MVFNQIVHAGFTPNAFITPNYAPGAAPNAVASIGVETVAVAPRRGKLSNLRLQADNELSDIPCHFTVAINGVDTALAAQIDADHQSAVDNTHTIIVQAGQLISFHNIDEDGSWGARVLISMFWQPY